MAASVGIFLSCTSIYFLCKWRSRRGYGRSHSFPSDRRDSLFEEVSSPSNTDLPVMDLGIIQAATCNFSDDNKLGEGGFGPVYKVLIPRHLVCVASGLRNISSFRYI